MEAHDAFEDLLLEAKEGSFSPKMKITSPKGNHSELNRTFPNNRTT